MTDITTGMSWKIIDSDKVIHPGLARCRGTAFSGMGGKITIILVVKIIVRPVEVKTNFKITTMKYRLGQEVLI